MIVIKDINEDNHDKNALNGNDDRNSRNDNEEGAKLKQY